MAYRLKKGFKLRKGVRIKSSKPKKDKAKDFKSQFKIFDLKRAEKRMLARKKKKSKKA